jgi:hypothetical protein
LPRLLRLKTFEERFDHRPPTSPHAYQFIPTYFVKEWLVNELEILSNDWSVRGSERDDENARVCALAHQIDAHLGKATGNGARRIWSILSEEFQNVSIDVADSLLIALGHRLEDQDWPILPASRNVAREMVDSYFEFNPDKADHEFDKEELAEMLNKFTAGFGKSDEIFFPEVRRKEEARRAGARKRARSRRAAQRVAA